MAIDSGIAFQVDRRIGVGHPLGALARGGLLRSRRALLVELEQLATPIAPLDLPAPEIECLPHQRMTALGMVEVLQYDDAEALRRYEADDRRHAVDRAGVEIDARALVVELEPAEAVGGPVRLDERDGRVEGGEVEQRLG